MKRLVSSRCSRISSALLLLSVSLCGLQVHAAAASQACEIVITGAAQANLDHLKSWLATRELTTSADRTGQVTPASLKKAIEIAAPLLGTSAIERAKVLKAFGMKNPFQLNLLESPETFADSALTYLNVRHWLVSLFDGMSSAGTLENFKRQAQAADPFGENFETTKATLEALKKASPDQLVDLIAPYLGMTGAERVQVLLESGVSDPLAQDILQLSPKAYAASVVQRTGADVTLIVAALEARLQRHIDSGESLMVDAPAEMTAAEHKLWLEQCDVLLASYGPRDSLPYPRLKQLARLIARDTGLSVSERRSFINGLPDNLRMQMGLVMPSLSPEAEAFNVLETFNVHRGLLPLMERLKAKHLAALGL